MTDIKLEQFPIQHPMRVRYSEIDAQGVVFNAHYLTYFDTTINEGFRDTGIDWLAQARSTGCDVQLVKSLVEYRAPLKFDEEFIVGAGIARRGRSSITWQLGVFGKAGDLRATGEIVWVYADLAAHESRPLPQWMLDATEAHLIAP